MYDGMPTLVDARDPNPWPSATLANAGATPWHGGDSAPVYPGGFGAGTPQHPRQQQPFGPNASPAANLATFSPARSPAFGFAPSPSASTPWPLAPPSTSGAQDPFSIPAAAFDQGLPPPPMVGFGDPPSGFMPWTSEQQQQQQQQAPHLHSHLQSPSWYTPRARRHDLEEGSSSGDGEVDGGLLGGWDRGSWFAKPGGSEKGWDQWGFGKPPRASPSPSFARAFASGPRYQYKRPDDWRPDFTMQKQGALSRLFSIGSKDSIRSMLGKPALHRTLDAKATSCSWDVRQPPEAFLVLPEQRPLSYLELHEGALAPPPLRMQLTHAALPWTICVAAEPGAVITVSYLLSMLHGELMRSVFERDFWNDDVGEEGRKVIYAAWEARCAGDRAIARRGVKRVDFLGERYVFEGIKRVGETWELKMKPGRGRL